MSKILKPCVFLDRDGVINEDPGHYTYKLEAFNLIDGVPEALITLKQAGYILIVVSNQAGVAKGIYTEKEVYACHQVVQEATNHAIDALYFSPHHPDFGTASLGRKPGGLYFEKAISKFKLDPKKSWMLGDKERDLIPAKRLGIRTVRIGAKPVETIGDYTFTSLAEFVNQMI